MPDYFINFPWGIISFVCFGLFAAALIAWLILKRKAKKPARILLISWISLFLLGILMAILDVNALHERRKQITDSKLFNNGGRDLSGFASDFKEAADEDVSEFISNSESKIDEIKEIHGLE